MNSNQSLATVPFVPSLKDVTCLQGSPAIKVLSVESISRQNPFVLPSDCNNKVFDLFLAHPDVQSIPVLIARLPVGIISRHITIERYSQRAWREKNGQRPCGEYMDCEPLLTDKNTPVHAIGARMVESSHRHMVNGFIITEHGQYHGVGSVQSLLASVIYTTQ